MANKWEIIVVILTYLLILIGQILQTFLQLGGCQVREMRKIGTFPSITSLRVHWYDGQAYKINLRYNVCIVLSDQTWIDLQTSG